MKGKIFNRQEVQSIISGNKTMFREICKRQPQGEMEQPYVIRQAGITEFNYPFGKIPYQIGQKIFVKESWRAFTGETLGTPLGKMRIYSYPPKKGDIIAYKADQDLTKDFTSYLSSTTMPKWASRLTLLIKEIRVERLKDISEEDAIAEAPQYSIIQPFGNKCPIDFFKTLWNSTHKKPEEKFEANPWVWVVDFKINK